MTADAGSALDVDELVAVLAAHTSTVIHDPSKHDNGRSLVVGLRCKCGWETRDRHAADALHRSHVAEAVAAHVEALREADRAAALADMSDDEADAVDRSMGEHMYRHSISNNINGMSCGVGCRTRALAQAFRREVLIPRRAARSES